jgi:hypothetical protein
MKYSLGALTSRLLKFVKWGGVQIVNSIYKLVNIEGGLGVGQEGDGGQKRGSKAINRV